MRRFFPYIAAASVDPQKVHAATKAHVPLTPPDFCDSSCYADKSLYSILKSIAVLRLCSIEFLARNSVPLMKKAEKVIGPTLTYGCFVKHSVYSHFCAGENDQELKRSVKQLAKKNIGAVLDYAAEADSDESVTPAPGADEAPDISMESLSRRPDLRYNKDELAYDENMKLYMMAIMHATINTPPDRPGLTAVKVSGMCDPQLLARVSAILMSIHQGWCKYFTQENVPKIEECRVVMGESRKHQLYISYEQMRDGVKRRSEGHVLSDKEFQEVVRLMDTKGKGKISYFGYKQALTDAVIATAPTKAQQIIISFLPPMNATEKELWRKANERLALLASTARAMNVRMLIDAEQTFYQLAIDAIVAELAKTYNKDAPVVYNTYQCYLTYAEDRVTNDLIRAKSHGYQWGGKIVRGAYMVQERKTAKEYGFTSPICATYEATNENYNRTARRILDAMSESPDNKYEVFFGTHNRASLEALCQILIEKPELQERVTFGQLLGMRDNLTIPLAKAGFKVFKYVPYGPVKETIHYLGRRAVENAAVLSAGGSDEFDMMWREVRRRLTFR